MWKIFFTSGILFLLSVVTFAKDQTHDIPDNKKDSSAVLLVNTLRNTDSLLFSNRLIHKISIETRPDYILPTCSFLRGNNYKCTPFELAFSTHFRYAFGFQPSTCNYQIYNGAYQGVGIAYFTFNNQEELGNPFAFYLFQGASITKFSPHISLNYEWNFGVSFGWKPYNILTNPYNEVIGSKINAYINVNFYLSWALSDKIDLTAGLTLTHFSNGNTKFPNAGLNSTGLKTGLVYNIDKKSNHTTPRSSRLSIPLFPRHVSYDLVLFGAWRRTGVDYQDVQIASPRAYSVFGFGFAPMYNFGYKFRMGVSLDGVYDGSANVYTTDYGMDSNTLFHTPPLSRQLALGLSGRAEYIMPYFTVGLSIGRNVLHGKGDLDASYQTFSLKVEAFRNSFINIGYSLKDFHEPNFLMLGFGFRFHNKYPVFYR